VFWRAEAILHKAGVPAGNKAIELLGERTGAFQVDFSRDYEVFDPKVLRRYDAIVLNSTAHLALPEEKQRQALLDYVRGGGGVVGIHAAIDMFKRWPEGAQIVGATFNGHPWGPGSSWAVKLEEPEHPLLAAFAGQDFKLQDEFYELGEPYSRGDRRVLMKLDTRDAATAGVTPLHREDKDFAVAWVKRFGKGRVFYGMFGHRAEPFMNPAVLRFYLDGIQYALGDLPVEDSPRR
jgi:type 1 glutamine amidotransferase